MPILALFKLIPLKDWFYIGCILAITIGFASYTIHERHLGAAKEDAKITAKVAIAEKKTVAAESTAQTTETQSVLIYKQAVSVPAVADLGIVCHNSASPVSLPASDAVKGAGAGERSADRGTGQSFDPSGPVLQRSAVADAQIAYLQRRVHELEAEMNAAP